MIVSVGAAVAIVAVATPPAFAQISTTTSSSRAAKMAAALTARITTITKRADQEIARRLAALNALESRVNAMARLSATDKSNLSTSIQTQIAAMNTLQSQIAADAAANSTTSLKTDVQSITVSYRIFALILPQGAIEAASDRALTIVGTMNDLGTKFSARISAAQTAGNNVTAAQAALTAFNAKVSDAGAQATAAAAEVASLVPDNGSSTVMASNTAALKDARSKIQTAQQDFVSARADALTIIKALSAFKGSMNVSSTVSASSSAPAL